MLFKQKFLRGITNGTVKLAIRKWTKPTVKQYGTLLTPVGQLSILSVSKIQYLDISDQEVLEAGYDHREELDQELSKRDHGDIYRIRFELVGADPRIALRENSDINDDEFLELLLKLHKLDSRGRNKNWTLKVLRAIRLQPGQFAREYASELGYEKAWLKINIRKLKTLGLTISLPDGYDISPRGKALLDKIDKQTNISPSNNPP